MTHQWIVSSIQRGWLAAIVLLCGTAYAGFALAVDPQEKPTSIDAWHDFTDADRKTLMAFLIQNDMGNSTRPTIIKLLHDNSLHEAEELVANTYGVPKHTADLFITFEARSNGLDPSDAGK